MSYERCGEKTSSSLLDEPIQGLDTRTCPLAQPFAWIKKTDHHLDGRNMGRQVESFLLAYLDSIYEQDFQQEKVQLEEHVQHTTSHQYPDKIWMKKDRKSVV